ncbi:DUF3037 domain-containing protein [Pedobacter sp.]|uniref:DUF3037 domain-containing protein n=1 Tax=Pedobacter sp. TaxID=1411316 RepID=UPI003BACA8C1
MQEKFLFEYAVIRVMPRVEREEFLNVGIILYCAKQKFLKSIFTIDEEKLKTFTPETDIQEIQENLLALQRISSGSEGSGTIGAYDIASRFRWLTATRSTIVQCSKVHPGFCADAEETLIKLHEQLVL